MTAKYRNKLADETSLYLLQHAHNPVDWYPWGEEALGLARQQDKPILVSIGYAACHWCHVMERESFENPEVAAFMNEHFINIKIDREERPDLDHIYMDAVQALTGSGGWPLNVFLTPDARPFYGGTYFPPRNAYKRMSWMDVLANISKAWHTRKDEIMQQASQLVAHISSGGGFFKQQIDGKTESPGGLFSEEQCYVIARNMLRSADKTYGGFGQAPKFPQTFSIQYLLAYGHSFEHAESLEHALLSLQQMLDGGIYDHLAGGLARYSTDSHWLAPHFEKMLYDNALLVNVLSDAYQVSGKPEFESAIHKTIKFLLGEMKHANGGFFAALDADSEGEEGRFYVWSKQEVEEVLGKDAGLFCKWFNVTDKGNWEGKNILHINSAKAAFARANGLDVPDFEKLIGDSGEKLLKQRNTRIRPLTDDKILLGWNALLVTALCKASAALGDDRYRQEAVELFRFLVDKFSVNGRVCLHTYKNGEAKYPAFLDDYAFLIQACIYLQELTADPGYLLEAEKLTRYVIEHFEDKETGCFYYTGKDQHDAIVRKMDCYDGALPSGNSIMAENLYYLSLVFENNDWAEKAERLVSGMSAAVEKYPTSFAVWATILLKQCLGMNEVIITGMDFAQKHKEMLRLFMPNKVLQCHHNEVPGFPLLKDKDYAAGALIYLCRERSCQKPVNTIRELLLLLKKPLH